MRGANIASDCHGEAEGISLEDARALHSDRELLRSSRNTGRKFRLNKKRVSRRGGRRDYWKRRERDACSRLVKSSRGSFLARIECIERSFERNPSLRLNAC